MRGRMNLAKCCLAAIVALGAIYLLACVDWRIVAGVWLAIWANNIDRSMDGKQ